MSRPFGRVRRERSAPVLITGGAGFIGTNLAARLLENGRRVRVFDNLSRAGVPLNLQWLRDTYGERVDVRLGDIRDADAVSDAVAGVCAVYHFAAQVAVTSSLADPRHDFGINAAGTLNLLEALRALDEPPALVFTSTNKVYGDLEDVELVPESSRYVPADSTTRDCGISESRSVDFHSPYGCSKGSADQYVLDYARTFGLPAVVFRMSCIYGPHQFGTEDQGWVAHFLIRAIENRPITIYGDGLQVRDILYVDDLVRAFLLAEDHIERIAGQAFNIGGGPSRTISLVELVEIIRHLQGRPLLLDFDAWREADQRYYVSDTRKFEEATGWQPLVSVAEGVRALYGWLCATRIPAEPLETSARAGAPEPLGGELSVGVPAAVPLVTGTGA
jgi:CDP-paratose 2-epimerase